MPDTAGGRRTRSQLPSLPDEILLIPQRSPLKDARMTLRNQGQSTPRAHGHDGDLDLDDDILLSPERKIATLNVAGKRSASPERDPAPPRQSKRLKKNDSNMEGEKLDDGGSDAENQNVLQPGPKTHGRHLSEPKPETYRPTQRKRSTTPGVQPPPPSPSKNSRARSVPIFPTASSMPSMTSSESLPKVDFTTLPPSPLRSPTFKIRMMREPEQPVELRLDSITDEGETMEVDQQNGRHSKEPRDAEKATMVDVSDSVAPPPRVTFLEVPSTPVQRTNYVFDLGSPLTPVPPTPAPPRGLQADGDDMTERDSRYSNEAGWDLGSNNSATQRPDALAPTAATGPAVVCQLPTKRSRLPRPAPSSSAVPPPPDPPTKSKQSSGDKLPAGASKNTRGSSTKSSDDSSKVIKTKAQEVKAASKLNKPNVTSVLMEGARLQGSKAKGKEKGKEKMEFSSKNVASSSKAAASSVFHAQSSAVKTAGESSKSTVRSKMRPREKPPKPVPQVILYEEEEEEAAADDAKGEVKESEISEPTMDIVMSESQEGAVIVQDIEIDQEKLIGWEKEVDVPADSSSPLLSPLSDTSPLTPAEDDNFMEKEDNSREQESRMDVDVPHPIPIPDLSLTSHENIDGGASASVSRSIDTPAVDEGELPEETSVAPLAEGTPLPAAFKSETSLRRSPRSRTKPRLPIAVGSTSSAGRVTRSSSLKRKAEDQPDAHRSRKRSFSSTLPASPVKKIMTKVPTIDSRTKCKSKAEDVVTVGDDDSMSSLSDVPMSSEEPRTWEVGKALLSSTSHSYARPTAASLARSPTKAQLRSPSKTSPVKISRSSSSLDVRPKTIGRTYTYAEGSSLSSLASALERLKRPPPARPNTSLGFNHATSNSTPDCLPNSDASKVSAVGGSSSSKFVQKPIGLFMGKKDVNGRIFTGGGTVMRGGFGRGRGRATKVSRNPGLPSVMGSPVKGGGQHDSEDVTMEDAADDTLNATSSVAQFTSSDGTVMPSKGKGKAAGPSDWRKNAARRASMAAEALSQSLSALPVDAPSSGRAKGLMGPPATPPKRGGLRSASNPVASTSSANGEGKGGKAKSPDSAKPKLPTLSVLKQCKIFVDVKDANGADSSDLWVEMLQKLGARVMASAGQTCTHIVYRNGMLSTQNRYRLLEPKPFVVSITWVAACAESQKHVDEADYLVDLESINVAGKVKRRKSMIPKMIPREWDEEVDNGTGDGDVSMASSNSSIMIDEDLPPLERARRRQAMLSART